MFFRIIPTLTSIFFFNFAFQCYVGEPFSQYNFVTDTLAVRAILDANGYSGSVLERYDSTSGRTDTANGRIIKLNLIGHRGENPLIPELVIPKEIEHLTALDTLLLASNLLTDLPDYVFNLPALTFLDLRVNRFDTLPERIGNLKSLKFLTVEDTPLSKLPESIGNLKELEILRLGGRNLQGLPKSIGNLNKLILLDLKGNKLVSLPEELGGLSSLTQLSLELNELAALPNSIGDLSELTILSIMENKLSSLPKSIGNLNKLSFLGLNRNQLETLPDEITQLDSVRIVVSTNRLCELNDQVKSWLDVKSPNWQVSQECSSTIRGILSTGSETPSYLFYDVNGKRLRIISEKIVVTFPAYHMRYKHRN